MSSNAAKKLLLLALSAGATLALAETALRALYPTKTSLYELDERRLFRLVPNATRLFVHSPENGGAWVLTRINADGFRGPSLESAECKIRVAVYGDSCIMGEFSPEEETYAAQLELALAEQTGRPVQVVNAGVAAYGPGQSILRMEEEWPTLNPQLVVLALFAHNDFGDLLRNKLFLLDSEGRLQSNPGILDDRLLADFRHARWPILAKLAWLQFERLHALLRPGLRPEPIEHTPEAYKELWKRDYR